MGFKEALISQEFKIVIYPSLAGFYFIIFYLLGLLYINS